MGADPVDARPGRHDGAARSAARTPRRHPEQPLKPPALLRAMGALCGVRAPDEQQLQRLGAALLVGDEPMDRLLEWMMAEGLKKTRPLFERAVTEGVAAVPDAPAPLREFFALVEQEPAWLDRDLMRRGQTAFRITGRAGAYAGRDIALIGGYMFSGFNQTLIRTGALETGSNRRFAETLRWARGLTAAGGLEPQGVGYCATLRVRLIHALVRRHVSRMDDWQPEEWGLPVNQTDMAATLVGALIAPVTGAMMMGIVQRPRDLDAVGHMVRYVGWLLGVEEEWLPHDFRDGVRILVQTAAVLAVPDETTPQLAVPMAEDPLLWNYPHAAGLRRRFARAQHLSLTSILGPRNMRTMGLPVLTVPWYPAAVLPGNLLRSGVALAHPGARARAARRGSRQVDAFLRELTGDLAEIGGSVEQLRDHR